MGKVSLKVLEFFCSKKSTNRGGEFVEKCVRGNLMLMWLLAVLMRFSFKQSGRMALLKS